MYIDNKLRVIIINGYPGSGKDTFVEFCNSQVPTAQFHTSTPAKQALARLGWDEKVKTPEVRKALADLKQMSTTLFDGPYRYISRQLTDIKYFWAPKDWTVFIHSREPEEIERFARIFNAHTLFIDREPTEELSNDADKNVSNYKYDLVIKNDGTLQELQQKAYDFVKQYIEGGIW